MTFNSEVVPATPDSTPPRGVEAESQAVLERMQIERPNEKTLSYDRSRLMIPNILDSPKLRPYLVVSEEERKDLEDAVKHYEYKRIGLGTKGLSENAQETYHRAIERLMSSPESDPYFAVADSERADMYHLAIENGKPLTVREREGKFYVLYKVPEKVSLEQRDEISQRIKLLTDSPYFPIINVATDAIEVEYIPSTELAQKGEDVTDFYDYCRQINFGADTNTTNFLRYQGQLKYTDQDLIHWLVNPASKPFQDEARDTKPQTW